MEKIIVFEEKEFENKLYEFSKNFIEYSKKGYGNSLICNETNDVVNMEDEKLIAGIFMLPWRKTFGREK